MLLLLVVVVVVVVDKSFSTTLTKNCSVSNSAPSSIICFVLK